MSVTNVTYNNIGTAIAFTSLDGLADGGWASSALVDNQVNLYLEVFLGGTVQTGTQTGGRVDFFVAASWDGVEFTSFVDGGDQAITWGFTGSTVVGGFNDLKPIGSIQVDGGEDNLDHAFGPFNVAAYFDGWMPLEWCIVVQNNTGGALHATGTNNHLEYTGITATHTA